MLSNARITSSTSLRGFELLFLTLLILLISPGLDLSSLHHILITSEPVRRTTPLALNMLHEYGLREKWFYTAYGLAENVVACVWYHGARVPRDKSRGDLVACGHRSNFHSSLIVKIVSETEFQEVPDGQIGEIWIGGPSKAAG